MSIRKNSSSFSSAPSYFNSVTVLGRRSDIVTAGSNESHFTTNTVTRLQTTVTPASWHGRGDILPPRKSA